MSTEASLEQAEFPFETREEEDRFVRSSAALLGSAAIVGMVAGGAAGFELANYGETSSNAKDLRIADGYERCVSFIEDQLKPGDTTITIKASSLSKKQQDDCGVVVPDYVTKPEKHMDPDSGVSFRGRGEVETTVKVTSAEVTLDTVDNYKAAQENREDRSGYDHIPVIAATPLGVVVGLMGGLFIADKTIYPVRYRRLLKKSAQKNSRTS